MQKEDLLSHCQVYFDNKWHFVLSLHVLALHICSAFFRSFFLWMQLVQDIVSLDFFFFCSKNYAYQFFGVSLIFKHDCQYYCPHFTFVMPVIVHCIALPCLFCYIQMVLSFSFFSSFFSTLFWLRNVFYKCAAFHQICDLTENAFIINPCSQHSDTINYSLYSSIPGP